MSIQREIDVLAKKYGRSTTGILVLEMALKKALSLEGQGWLGAWIGDGYVSISSTPRFQSLLASEKKNRGI